MELNTQRAESPIHPAAVSDESVITGPGERVIRQEFYPPYANPPISNYRKFWATSPALFWTVFGVQPGNGHTISQLGTNHPPTSIQKAFQEVGFGYTFKAAFTTDYWLEVDIDAGPGAPNPSVNTIELELLGSDASKVVIPLTTRYFKSTATIAARLSFNTQYTLLFKSKITLPVWAGENRYSEILARFPRLVVNYIRPRRPEPEAAAESAQDDSIDLGLALELLKAGEENSEVLFQPVSYKEIAQAGLQGFGGFNDGGK